MTQTNLLELTDSPPKVKKERKRDLLLRLLKSGRRMSKQEILRECRIWNSGHVVWLWRKDGVDIKTEMVTRGEETYALYYIETNQEAA